VLIGSEPKLFKVKAGGTRLYNARFALLFASLFYFALGFYYTKVRHRREMTEGEDLIENTLEFGAPLQNIDWQPHKGRPASGENSMSELRLRGESSQ
jgi:hypothetical protein